MPLATIGEHESEGEEAGEYIRPGKAWDETRRRVRLILAFDPAQSAFGGTVENTTPQTLCAVRVEVHWSSGVDLGPTERTDLAPGESVTVYLPTAGESFASWTAHREVSACGPWLREARVVQAQPMRDATAPALTVDPHSGKLRTLLIGSGRLVAAMPLDR